MTENCFEDIPGTTLDSFSPPFGVRHSAIGLDSIVVR
jgi:hypothetical protein